MKIKICLYLEFYHFLDGAFFKKIGTGLLSSYRNQRAMLAYLGVNFTEKWDPSADILQINTPWLKSIYLIKKAKRRGMKVIIWSHVTVEDAMQVFWFMPLIAPLFKKYLIYAYGLADLILSPTEYTKSLLLAYGLSEAKIAVQSNGVDLQKFYKNNTKRLSGRNKYGLNLPTVGTIALVIPRKGTDTFLELARKFTGSQFIWFGKIYSGALVKPLPKNLPSNARFTGFVDDILEAYNSLDIFIFPSYEENQGMSILEAGAVGIPIIVRDIPVYSGWLIDGVNSLKAKNDEDFADKLKLLLENEDLRKKLSENMREAVLKQHSLEAVGVRLKEVYNKLLYEKLG